jgi:hypothetical protein
MVLTSAPGVALGQTDEWRPDLIAKYESEGGQNIPNFRFDGPQGPHSAGGVCQMLTHTWERIAPTIDIDVAKFPVAGAATEFDQWRACWKLWTVEGYTPWICCNARLRQVLGRRGVDATPTRKTSGERRADSIDDKVAVLGARLTANSDVYHLSR